MESKKSPRILQKNIEFFTAALSQHLVSVWQEDPTGVYCEIGCGYIELFSSEVIRVRNQDGTPSHYDRNITMFQLIAKDQPI
ncbi:hypothetical protein ACFQ5D_21200 [Paenibacillus farraposensis]|uniref:Uncharacterized protein n=1 Tax=Paenibacillus farraposensis TaxID=2807095 RepID=A0ABW4DKM7_9BACL|nr:hypothetical protein [Paenibacillus farraposensis]MCC3378603.1 hypothetical protein [Paenibacillus farraposensis]